MKLSLIIPNYNNEEYLRECLDSVINQTYRPYEVIIVDDCSTDNSRKIIKEYEKKYDFIKSIFNKENLWVAETRDIGIRNAEGDYVTTLDSDDYFYNDEKLEKEVELIKNYRKKYNKEIIPYSNTVRVDLEGKPVKTEFNKKNAPEGNILFTFLTLNKPRPRDFIFKKSDYIEVGGFDTSLDLYEDNDLKIRLSIKREFFYTGVKGVAYRQHDNGISSAHYKKHIKNLRMLFKKYSPNLPLFKRFLANIRFYHRLIMKTLYNKTKHTKLFSLYKKIKNKIFKKDDFLNEKE